MQELYFTDIHCHALYGTDDGARTAEQMHAIVDAAYRDGTRVLCLTPHFHPGYYDDNRESSRRAYEELTAYVEQAYPDLTLALGNELHYAPTSLSWLREGMCRTLNGTRYVLVDFSSDASAKVILDAVTHILGGGYRPVLAHVERYARLSWYDIETLKDRGVCLQINAGSLTGLYGGHSKRMARKLVRARFADVVGSDAHSMDRRPPGISLGYAYILKHTDAEYAEDICSACGKRLLFGK